MITAAQIAALDVAAESWKGTPFCEGSPIKGAGVSCHHLCAEVLFEAGLIARIPVPNGPSRYSPAEPRSLIAEWVEQSGLFVAVEGPPMPADLLGFRVVNAVHHAAIALGGGRIVHSVMGHGVLIAAVIPAMWAPRLQKIWRLKTLA